MFSLSQLLIRLLQTLGLAGLVSPKLTLWVKTCVLVPNPSLGSFLLYGSSFCLCLKGHKASAKPVLTSLQVLSPGDPQYQVCLRHLVLSLQSSETSLAQGGAKEQGSVLLAFISTILRGLQ